VKRIADKYAKRHHIHCGGQLVPARNVSGHFPAGFYSFYFEEGQLTYALLGFVFSFAALYLAPLLKFTETLPLYNATGEIPEVALVVYNYDFTWLFGISLALVTFAVISSLHAYRNMGRDIMEESSNKRW
jgi:hypothetical protein